ncbi:hypothetical protein THAOC_26846, partial [Thalassiosira oceanica]
MDTVVASYASLGWTGRGENREAGSRMRQSTVPNKEEMDCGRSAEWSESRRGPWFASPGGRRRAAAEELGPGGCRGKSQRSPQGAEGGGRVARGDGGRGEGGRRDGGEEAGGDHLTGGTAFRRLKRRPSAPSPELLGGNTVPPRQHRTPGLRRYQLGKGKSRGGGESTVENAPWGASRV